MYGLGITGCVSINLFIGWVLGIAVGKTHLSESDAVYLLQVVLSTPKATGGKVQLFFDLHDIIDIR